MKLLSLFVVLVMGASGLVSCSNSTNLPYSALGRSQHLHLEGDGYLLGFEKIKRGEAQLLGSVAHEKVVRYPKKLEQVEKHDAYKRYFDQEIIAESRLLLATQIVRYDEGRPDFQYNVYRQHPRSRGEDISEGNSWNELRAFRKDLRGRLASGRYTHILVMCMGWNNDQHDAVFRYNQLVKNIRNASPNGGFRPLVIGTTWPSAWLTRSNTKTVRTVGHLFSYFNKSDDADELGIVYLNWLLHSAIPSAQPRNEIPVVALGHSFGARAMSRAIHSRDYLITPHGDREPVDLFVGLQAAVSVNRYLPGESPFRGAAYADLPLKTTLIVYTSSKHDRSNLTARYVTWARNMGAKFGALRAQERPELDYRLVDGEPPVLTGRPRPGIPLVVDAASFVKKGDKDGTGFEVVSPHNDILDKEMGQFVRSCIDQVR